jgi:pimeloyl-ACP methyl ester carboxylesterase
LHGYALGQFAMSPWALRLAEEGWRCVLVDLRGHGKSTGRRIYYGLRETRDLSQLLDALARDGRLSGPVAVMGESYGAALALRWKGLEPRVGAVVAIAPYAELAKSAMNLRADYAPWLPSGLVRAGLEKLPILLDTQPEELDTTTVLKDKPVPALFVAGGNDSIAPEADVRRLEKMGSRGSELVVVRRATHESLIYFFDDLVPPVLAWLGRPSDE